MKSFMLSSMLAVGFAAALSAPTAFAVGGLNVVRGGNGELSVAVAADSSVTVPDSWATVGGLIVVKYKRYSIPGLDDVSAVRPGPAGGASLATRTVILPSSVVRTATARKIKPVLIPALGGWDVQSDASTATYLFLDTGGKTPASAGIGLVMPAQRGSVSKLLLQQSPAEAWLG